MSLIILSVNSIKNFIMYLSGWLASVPGFFLPLLEEVSFNIIDFIYKIYYILLISLLTIPGHHGYPFIFTQTMSPMWYFVSIF